MNSSKCAICSRDTTGIVTYRTQDGASICSDCKKKAGGFFYNTTQKLLTQIIIDISARQKK